MIWLVGVYLVGLMFTGLCVYLAVDRGFDWPASRVEQLFAVVFALVAWPVTWVLVAREMSKGSK